MSRNKLRLAPIYRFFKNNALKFAEFLEYDPTDKEFFEMRGKFLARYEELLSFHVSNPDLRLGQLLYNEGISHDLAYYREEAGWILTKEYLKPEDIIAWGGFGIDGEERATLWKASKPKFEDPITPEELIWYKKDLYELPHHEYYAIKYHNWLNAKPKPDWKLIRDLSVEHLKAIIKTQQVSANLLIVFNKMIERHEAK